MLTRFVRIQLAVFTIASIVGVLVMAFAYMQVPTFLGIGRITVKLELPASGGLYRFSNVTYRGVEVGKVTGMDVSRTQATATLKLDTSPKIPADLVAEVRSVSAVGEQYVELMPRTDSPPYLEDGSVIAMADTKLPQAVGPMLDQVSTLINSVPKEKIERADRRILQCVQRGRLRPRLALRLVGEDLRRSQQGVRPDHQL